jgi:hypothetical protein
MTDQAQDPLERIKAAARERRFARQQRVDLSPDAAGVEENDE